MQQKYYKQQQISNADYVSNLIETDNSTYYISMPNTGKRTMHKEI